MSGPAGRDPKLPPLVSKFGIREEMERLPSGLSALAIRRHVFKAALASGYHRTRARTAPRTYVTPGGSRILERDVILSAMRLAVAYYASAEFDRAVTVFDGAAK